MAAFRPGVNEARVVYPLLPKLTLSRRWLDLVRTDQIALRDLHRQNPGNAKNGHEQAQEHQQARELVEMLDRRGDGDRNGIADEHKTKKDQDHGHRGSFPRIPPRTSGVAPMTS